MMELRGKYNSCKVFTNNIEPECISQLITLLNQPFVKDCNVRIMPDCHAGAGCVIGFTANLGDKIVPNLVGVDIGCGVLTIPIDNIDVDLKKLDNVIREYIPSGFNIRKHSIINFSEMESMYCYDSIKYDKENIEKAIGTLGGGNHFIELDVDDNGNKYLLIHTGSRHFGLLVAKYYQKLAIKQLENNSEEITKLIAKLKLEYREKDIQSEIENYKKNNSVKIPKDLVYLTDELRDKYLFDMRVCQEYAKLNRYYIARFILENLFNDCNVNVSYNGRVKIKQKGKYDIKTQMFDTIHNYIGDDNIIRKGAISAYSGERLIIPINMRDGAIIGIGKSNEDYNFSAPHGAGRILSRSKAKEILELSEFSKQMEGIYSTCINEGTLDESPMAYKNINDILPNIVDTVEVEKIIKPIYNFKASE